MVATSRIGVVGGGVSCEHDVSLSSAAAVAQALARKGYRVDRFTIERDGRWRINDGPARPPSAAFVDLAECDAVFPVMHGPVGEDGTIAALCELLGVPYVGSGVLAGAVAMDKWATKCVVSELGFRVAPGILLHGPAEAAREDPALSSWDGPAVVKPVAAGSSYGVTLARDASALRRAVDEAFAWDERVLVEEYVEGRELDVAVWPDGAGGHVAGPVLEIGRSGVFDTETKYNGQARFTVPADVPASLARELARAALPIFKAVDCRGIARADFFLAGDALVFNEINTTPGLTVHSQVPLMYQACGGEYADLIESALVAAVPGAVRAEPGLQEGARPTAVPPGGARPAAVSIGGARPAAVSSTIAGAHSLQTAH